jgi:hypothetical protein
MTNISIGRGHRVGRLEVVARRSICYVCVLKLRAIFACKGVIEP